MTAPRTELAEALANALAAELQAQAITDPGIVRIARERSRVLAKGHWSIEHDKAQHAHGELVDAAICYLIGHGRDEDRAPYERVPGRWPWDAEDFQPGSTGNYDADRLRDLERAGQLIAAEIARLTTSHGALPLGGERA